VPYAEAIVHKYVWPLASQISFLCSWTMTNALFPRHGLVLKANKGALADVWVDPNMVWTYWPVQLHLQCNKPSIPILGSTQTSCKALCLLSKQSHVLEPCIVMVHEHRNEIWLASVTHHLWTIASDQGTMHLLLLGWPVYCHGQGHWIQILSSLLAPFE